MTPPTEGGGTIEDDGYWLRDTIYVCDQCGRSIMRGDLFVFRWLGYARVRVHSACDIGHHPTEVET